MPYKNSLVLKFAATHANLYHQGIVLFNMHPVEVKFISLLSFKRVKKGFLVNVCLYKVDGFMKHVHNIRVADND